jgi:putative transposase
MAAYIDLNPVRAGIVADPLDYEWSGYGEACAGSRRAKRGMSKALSRPQDLWEKRTLPRYRIFLFDEGVEVEDEGIPEKAKRRGGVSKNARLKVQAEGGVLSGRVVLGKRISSFTNGVVYGRRKFVREAEVGGKSAGEVDRFARGVPGEVQVGREVHICFKDVAVDIDAVRFVVFF